MSGYGQFCPVAKAAELLGDRWTFLVIRELLVGSNQFNDIHRGVPKMSRTLLSRRLRMLTEAGIVERRHARGGRILYELSEAGWDLKPLVDMLGQWGERWLGNPLSSEEIDPALLVWELKRVTRPGQLSDRSVSVCFQFTDHPEFQHSLWRIQPDGRIEIVRADKSQNADLEVRAPTTEIAGIWLGRVDLEDAVSQGRVEIWGEPSLAQHFSRWLGRSPYVASARKTKSVKADRPRA